MERNEYNNISNLQYQIEMTPPKNPEILINGTIVYILIVNHPVQFIYAFKYSVYVAIFRNFLIHFNLLHFLLLNTGKLFNKPYH